MRFAHSTADRRCATGSSGQIQSWVLRFLLLVAPLALPAALRADTLSEPAQSAPYSDDAAAEMARKLQNPLVNIKALMTDNSVGFNTGSDKGTSYRF